jgi:homoserine O-acetyltransferase
MTTTVVGASPQADSLQQGLLQLPDVVHLHHGGVLNDVRLAWRLAGAPDAPVVLALGGISAHRTVYSAGEAQGWWDALVGPGRALDSRRMRVLGIDYLGGSAASSGPEDERRTGSDPSFPSISTYDQAGLIARLLDHLRLPALHAIVGASYGGMVALAFAERHPQRVQRLLVIGAADRPHPMATAWRSVQRGILRYALQHGEGAQGVVLARALAMATYRSAREFEQRFRGAPVAGGTGFVFPVEQYLLARGAQYADSCTAAAFLCLSESIDLHAVDPGRIVTPLAAIGFTEDQLAPIGDLRSLCARSAGPSRLFELGSLYGHDAFLKEAAQLLPLFRSILETPVHDFALS